MSKFSNDENPRLAVIRARAGELAEKILEGTGKKFTRSGDELRGDIPWRNGSDSGGLAVNIHTGAWFDHASNDKGDALKLLALVENLPTEGPEFIARTVARAEELFGIVYTNPPTGDPLAQLAAVRGWTRDALARIAEPAKGVVRFPMRDGEGNITGHRRRRANGEKFTKNNVKSLVETGGHLGLHFDPAAMPQGRQVFLLEGEADLAAFMSIRPDDCAIATPGATPGAACFASLEERLKMIGAERAIAFPDADTAGEGWLARVGEACRAAGVSVHVATLPEGAKDVDDALASISMTERADALAAMIEQAQAQPLAAELPVEEEGATQGEGDQPPAEFIHAPDFIASPPDTSYLVKGLLPRRGIGQVFGPSNSGKTFVVLDLAAAIITGKDWHGHRVTKGPVLYIAAEGQTGLACRLRALSLHHGIPLVGLHLRLAPANLSDPADIRGLVARLLKELPAPPVLIVLDTLNGNFGPGDENNSEDMGRALMGLRTLAGAGEWLALSIHHTGHAERQRSRGHSSLLAALDVEIRITREKDDHPIKIDHSKLRDGRKMEPLYFELQSVNTGWADDDLEPMDSAVLVEADPPEDPARPLGKKQAQGWEILQSLGRAVGPKDPVRLDAFHAGFSEIEKLTGKRNRVLKDLEKRGLVKIAGEEIFLT